MQLIVVGLSDDLTVAKQPDVRGVRQARVRGPAGLEGALGTHRHLLGPVCPEREPARRADRVNRDVAAALAQRLIYKGAIVLELARGRARGAHVRLQLLERAPR